MRGRSDPILLDFFRGHSEFSHFSRGQKLWQTQLSLLPNRFLGSKLCFSLKHFDVRLLATIDCLDFCKN